MYKVTLENPTEPKNNLEHKAADYEQAKYFFKSVVSRINKEEYNPTCAVTFYDPQGKVIARYLWN